MTVRKMAIYVEGQTEQIFLERLITEIAGAHHVEFAKRNVSDTWVDFHQIAANCETKYFVLLYDCQNDGKVKSKILEDRNKLAAAGYELILGVRDLYPTELKDLAKAKRLLAYGVPTAGVATHILFAVAEVEAWFLQDATHYAKIDPALDPATFKGAFGFDPSVDSAEAIPQPYVLLKTIYRSAKKAYKKKRAHVQRTVDALDVAHLWLDTGNLLPHFQVLAGHIDTFLSNEAAA